MHSGDFGHSQRLTAIVATDVARYSPLMAQDEQATFAALDDARHASFVFRVTASHGLASARVVEQRGETLAQFALEQLAARVLRQRIDKHYTLRYLE